MQNTEFGNQDAGSDDHLHSKCIPSPPINTRQLPEPECFTELCHFSSLLQSSVCITDRFFFTVSLLKQSKSFPWLFAFSGGWGYPEMRYTKDAFAVAQRQETETKHHNNAGACWLHSSTPLSA